MNGTNHALESRKFLQILVESSLGTTAFLRLPPAKQVVCCQSVPVGTNSPTGVFNVSESNRGACAS